MEVPGLPTVERNLVDIIGRAGGHVSLSCIKEIYWKTFQTRLLPLDSSMKKWINSFESLETRPVPNTNDAAVYVRSDFQDGLRRSNSKLSTSLGVSDDNFRTVELNLVDIIGRAGGHVSLSCIKEIYLKAFKTHLQTTGPTKKWINSFESLETRPVPNTNDTAVYVRANVMDHVKDTSDSFASSETPTQESSSEEIVLSICKHVGGTFKPIQVYQDSQSVLDLMPQQWADSLTKIGMEYITDISLDLGRRPYCWYRQGRVFLNDDHFSTVQDDDIQCIIDRLENIGSDNRSGIDKQLHRISCIRNNKKHIVGLTIRVGRHVEGNADIIRDLLMQNKGSILFLGEPGSGKTTIVRECTKLLSQEENVFVIDTSNEIAGHGNIPHACIGSARRMMVESLEAQSGTMIECVQNHTPSIMVIDEIGRKKEAEAAQTSKNRGVRMIASAHGDMRSLLKNKDIRGLVGGIETVTLGDEEARALQKKKGLKELRKQVTARAGPPVFEIIIELHRGKLHEWNIIMNSAQAVDDILLGDKYNVQKRVRCANTGRIFVEKVKH